MLAVELHKQAVEEHKLELVQELLQGSQLQDLNNLELQVLALEQVLYKQVQELYKLVQAQQLELELQEPQMVEVLALLALQLLALLQELLCKQDHEEMQPHQNHHNRH